jgi:hypothetical protein
MKRWILIVFDVPDRHAGLLRRFSFCPTARKPANYYRSFNPATDHDLAAEVRDHLRSAGLKGKWKEVEKLEPLKRRHGAIDFSKHNTSHGWRLKRRRRA